MGKIKNWHKNQDVKDVWCHANKQVVVTILLVGSRPFPRGNIYRAFAEVKVPQSIKKGPFPEDVRIIDGVNYDRTYHSAVSWMRSHPNGIRGALDGQYW